MIQSVAERNWGTRMVLSGVKSLAKFGGAGYITYWACNSGFMPVLFSTVVSGGFLPAVLAGVGLYEVTLFSAKNIAGIDLGERATKILGTTKKGLKELVRKPLGFKEDIECTEESGKLICHFAREKKKKIATEAKLREIKGIIKATEKAIYLPTEQQRQHPSYRQAELSFFSKTRGAGGTGGTKKNRKEWIAGRVKELRKEVNKAKFIDGKGGLFRPGWLDEGKQKIIEQIKELEGFSLAECKQILRQLKLEL